MLDSRFFNYVTNESGYSGYRLNNSALILFSKTNRTPLAAIHLSTSGITKSTFAMRSDSNIAQGLITEAGKKINFVISNLTNDQIKIDLMRAPGLCTETDPGPKLSLNKVNELKPYQSYCIPGDQLNNKELILDEILSSSGEKVKVSENSKETTEFYPTVFPKSNSELFKETYWSVENNVIIKESFIKLSRNNSFYNSNYYNNNRYFGSGPESNLTTYDTEEDDDGDLGCFDYSEMSGGVTSLESCQYQSYSCNSLAIKKKSKIIYDDSVKQKNILDSTAGKISYGETYSENSNQTGIKYNYTYQVPELKINLSIIKELKFINIIPELNAQIKHDIKSYIAGNWSEFMDKVKKYNEDVKECLYCLTDKPTVVLFPCAHLTSCSECIKQDTSKKCPLCRQLVYSYHNV